MNLRSLNLFTSIERVWRMMQNHQKFHNIVVSFALVIAGLWAVIEFIITTQPSIVIDTKCEAFMLDDSRTFLRIYATISNVGNADRHYDKDAELYVTVRDLQPSYEIVPDEVLGSIDFADSAQFGVFPLLGEGSQSMAFYPIIKPKEKQPYQFSFFIAPWVSDVSVYSSVRKKSSESNREIAAKIIHKGSYETCTLLPEGLDLDFDNFMGFKEQKASLRASMEREDFCITQPQQHQQPQEQQQQLMTVTQEKIDEIRSRLGLHQC